MQTKSSQTNLRPGVSLLRQSGAQNDIQFASEQQFETPIASAIKT